MQQEGKREGQGVQFNSELCRCSSAEEKCWPPGPRLAGTNVGAQRPSGSRHQAPCAAAVRVLAQRRARNHGEPGGDLFKTSEGCVVRREECDAREVAQIR